MGAIQDILSVGEKLRDAAREGEAEQERLEFQDKVKLAIREVFDDPDYPKRRRSFGAIRKKLFIFDDSSEDFSHARLRQILFSMEVEHLRGEGDAAYFYLPPLTQPQKAKDVAVGTNIRAPRRPSKLWLWFLLIVLLVLLALWLWPVISQVAGLFPSGTTSFQDCISSGEDTPERWALCYSKHPD
ncbi:hypothetical protein TRP8649_04463 [Pelagimonas phthalicica]|uniref:Uncharacterized protein n=1 Tax=Pelagimonas phthalicica TaxID=1037362 RepID=A0A238JI21_9RHOB|nr:hypothetical protein [Pelagimonas phthalicica]TDS90152.1 hypothetical protein CLV87_4209 [Pelagimonas phthalicica]SMX30320.1 hypothetical protein TRP8649_04463 [Pelagimonas phthalicica]